jgi:hypothetical protein
VRLSQNYCLVSPISRRNGERWIFFGPSIKKRQAALGLSFVVMLALPAVFGRPQTALEKLLKKVAVVFCGSRPTEFLEELIEPGTLAFVLHAAHEA